jgi:hypothetical protein
MITLLENNQYKPYTERKNLLEFKSLMKENFEHYISRSIRSFYQHRIVSPIIYLVILAVIAFFYPVNDMMHPVVADENEDIASLYDKNGRYIEITLSNLYFTGYTKRWLDTTVGYYYYTIMEDDCIIVLLNPDDSQQGLPVIDQITICGKILYNSHAMNKLLLYLSEDLAWSQDGIASTISPYMISQPDITDFATVVFLSVYVISGLYAFISIVCYGIYIAFPVLSSPVRRLRCYGKPREILAQAEEELATLPQLATEDMFITEHYFIETSRFGVAIVPISEMIWIYKYSTLHKFLWHHFSISYTLHITAAKRQYIHCPKNIKSDIDGIIDYLSEANHDILVGFSEANRLRES